MPAYRQRKAMMPCVEQPVGSLRACRRHRQTSSSGLQTTRQALQDQTSPRRDKQPQHRPLMLTLNTPHLFPPAHTHIPHML